ncbi:MAG: DUF87 domain-containing protein [Bacteroidota bacterium]
MDKEIKKRQPKLIVVIGKKGIGKTFTTLQLIRQYLTGNPSKGVAPRRVLIFDINNEYSQFKSISLKHIAIFSMHPTIECRRVAPFNDDGTKMGINQMNEALNFILINYSNGLLLAEDINRYASDIINMDIIGNLATMRHINCDVIIHFQLKGKAGNPKIMGFINVMRIHKTVETFERHKDKFEGYLEILKISEKLVHLMNKKLPKDKQYFYCYADFDKDRIYGDNSQYSKYTKQEFTEAVKEYISENEKDTIKPLLSKKDAKGKAIYTYEKAYNTCLNDLVSDYYVGI